MRKILISGGSRGIGNAIAKDLLKEGHLISLGLRNLNSIRNTQLDPELNRTNRIILNKYDALDQSSARDWVKNTTVKFGGIDTIIHCAGILKKTNLIFI